MEHTINPEERIVELQKLYSASLVQGKEFAELKAIKTRIREIRQQLEYKENGNNKVVQFSNHLRAAQQG